ncbi:MAG TPA: hypothetical protein PKA27_08455 [Fimbriimonadaceae bacterium]|nr:hypothetical protein [Fimbriimonadaceae bacterium]
MVTKIIALVIGACALVDFSGTYKGEFDGEPMTLTLKQSGSSLTGTAKVETFDVTLSATVSGSNADGTLTLLGEKMPVKMTLNGNTLTMKVGEFDEGGKADWEDADEFKLTRSGSAPKPTEKPSEPAKPSGAGQKASLFKTTPTETLGNGTLYKHSSGGQFKVPQGWKVEEHEEGLLLVPPTPVEGEIIGISAESAQGKTDPSDPEVLAYLDEVVGAAVPGATRVGKVEPAKAGNGKGVALTWKSSEKKVRAYVTILKGHGIAVVAIGSESQVDKRENVLKEIFFTLGWGQGQTDKRLVGTWAYYSYSQISGRETKASAVLRADGTFSYRSDSEAASNLSGKNSLGNESWVGWVNSRSGSGYDGTWVAVGNTLTLNFEDGSSESFDFEFQQQGTAFVLKLYGNDPKKPMEWSKQG